MGLDEMDPPPFRFRTPHGRPITSAPAVAGGRVFFGCDDGFLYILGKGPAIKPGSEKITVDRRKGRVSPAGGKAYAWPSAFGGSGNTNFVDDDSVKPPFRIRWATPSQGCFKQAITDTGEDVDCASLSGFVSAREQTTGRFRWIAKLPGQGKSRGAILYGQGNVYVP